MINTETNQQVEPIEYGINVEGYSDDLASTCSLRLETEIRLSDESRQM